jgi:outer membrane receptor protein involved in Fe transport
MVYARVANGFRPGSGVSNPAPNSICLQLDEPCQVNPDKITNYEIGIKADFLNHTLSVDSSLYYIDWKDIQVRITTSPIRSYNGNGSGAKSQGADLAFNWKPLRGLTVSTWGSWDQAVLTQPFSAAAAGQPLPYSARFSGNFSVEENVLVTGNIHAFFAGKEIYMGDRLGEFSALNAPRQDLPAYSQTDLNAGIEINPWTFNLYVNNVTDRRGLLYGGANTEAPFQFDYIKPRTIGLSIERSF